MLTIPFEHRQLQQQNISEKEQRPKIDSASPVRSNVSSNMISNQQSKSVTKSSNSDSDPELNRNNSNKQDLFEANRKQNIIEPKPLASQPRRPAIKQVHRVRISSVVEDIETKQHFKLDGMPKRNEEENDFNNDDNEDAQEESSDEKNKPYELTRPMKSDSRPETENILRNVQQVPVIPADHQPKVK